MPRIRSRTGWVRARSCSGVGVIELVSTTTNISLQRTICKQLFVVGGIVRDQTYPRTVFPQGVSSRTVPAPAPGDHPDGARRLSWGRSVARSRAGPAGRRDPLLEACARAEVRSVSGRG